MKTCTRCGERLQRGDFRGPASTVCVSCLDDARQNRPRSDDDVQALVRAAQALLDVCRVHLDAWPETDLAAWRNLVDAIDRRYGAEYGK